MDTKEYTEENGKHQKRGEEEDLQTTSGAKLAPIFMSPVACNSSGKIKTPKRKRTDTLEEIKLGNTSSRVRTPSGHSLAGKVGGLKDLFQFHMPITQAALNIRTDHGNTGIVNTGDETVSTEILCIQAESAITAGRGDASAIISEPLKQNKQHLVEKEKQRATTTNEITFEDFKRLMVKMPDNASKDFKNPLKMTDVEVEEALRRNTAEEKVERAKTGEKDMDLVDIRVVMKLFRELKADFKDTRRDLETLMATGSTDEGSRSRFNDVEKAVENYECVSQENDKKWKRQTTRESILFGTLNRLTDCFDDAMKRVEKLESASAKRMMCISGFYADKDDKAHAIEQLKHFFWNDMDVCVDIEDIYYIGSNNPQNIVVTFLSNTQKQSIFKQISTIKNYVNKDGNKLIFRDYYTPEYNEVRRRKQDVINDNRRKEEGERVEIEYTGSSLSLNGRKCVNPISPPNPLEITEKSEEELDEIMSMAINITGKIRKIDNTLIGASAVVNSFEQIQKAYLSLRLKHPAARHIVAAWNIPTDQVYDGQCYCEDEEIGVGKPILDLLVQNDITHRVIFVIRYCGPKLNKERVPLYLEAAKVVIKQAPFNRLLRKEQNIAEDDGRDQRNVGRRRGRGGPPTTTRKEQMEDKKKFSPKKFTDGSLRGKGGWKARKSGEGRTQKNIIPQPNGTPMETNSSYAGVVGKANYSMEH